MTSLPMLSPKSQPRPWVSGSSGKIWGLPLAPLQSLSWAQRGGKGAPGSLLPQLLCSGRVLGTRASTTLRPGCTPALQELRTILPAINASALTQASSAPERLGSHRGKEGHAPPPRLWGWASPICPRSIDTDESRYPQKLAVAECLCKGCISARTGRETAALNSVPLHQSLLVLRRQPCSRDATGTPTPGAFTFHTESIRVPIGCTCVLPRVA